MDQRLRAGSSSADASAESGSPRTGVNSGRSASKRGFVTGPLPSLRFQYVNVLTARSSVSQKSRWDRPLPTCRSMSADHSDAVLPTLSAHGQSPLPD